MNAMTSLSCRDSGAVVNVEDRRQQENAIIAQALAILGRRTARASYARADSPAEVKRHLVLTYGEAENEFFGVLWLDVKLRIIKREEAFVGTLAQCSIYARELVKAGLRLNAAKCILFHNHPSGEPVPSEADLHMTRKVQEALALVDIHVVDHIIVAGTRTHSFAEHGQI
jgi:DNA repair protein RadC